MSAAMKYLCLWREGSGEQKWAPGMTIDDFTLLDEGYADRGLRLTQLRVRNGQYTAVWREGSGSHKWAIALSLDEFKKRDSEYFNQGLRLVDIEIDGGKFTGVWRPGTGAQYWTTGRSWDEFSEDWNVQFAKGLRLVCVRLVGDKFTAIWRPRSDQKDWPSYGGGGDRKSSPYRDWSNRMLAEGKRLLDPEIHNGFLWYIEERGSGAQELHWDVDEKMVADLDAGYSKAGLRLVKLFPYDDIIDVESQARDIVAAHNRYRAEVGTPDLVWDRSLYEKAQAWADHLAATNTFDHSDAWGENLSWSSGDRLGTDAVASWGAEKANYHGEAITADNNYGHYTQIVWRGTTHIGCGAAKYANGATVWVCQYNPPGNMVGVKAY